MSLARHGRLQLVRLVLPMSSKLIGLSVSWGYILDLLYLIGVSLSFKLSAIAHFHFLFDLRGYRWLYNLPVPLGCSRLAANRRFLMNLPYQSVHSVSLCPSAYIFLLLLVYVDIVLTHL